MKTQKLYTLTISNNDNCPDFCAKIEKLLQSENITYLVYENDAWELIFDCFDRIPYNLPKNIEIECNHYTEQELKWWVRYITNKYYK